jgi:hypothetical protein
MATTARAPCITTPTLIPSWFSVSRDEAAAACSTSSGSVHFTLPSSHRSCRVCAAHPQLSRPNTGNKACPSLLRASGLSSSASWEGRSHLLHLLSSLRVNGDRQPRKSAAAGGVQASLLGVGAPEALVIGVVALLVFGPKGLAEVIIMCNSFCILLSFLLCTLLHPACSIRVFTDGKNSFRITPFFVLEKSS